MKNYEPELGQMIFGQPAQRYKTPIYLDVALECLQGYFSTRIDSLEKLKDFIDNPFDNTGAVFKNSVFEVQAYNWNTDVEQEFNFKWRDFKVSWYKWLGRGQSMNRKISKAECYIMLKECLGSLLVMTDEDFVKALGFLGDE